MAEGQNTGAPAFSLATLKRFVPQRKPVEQCDLCSAPVSPEHDHLVEPASRKINCACPACALLFSGQAGTKYKRVPREGRYLADFQMTDQQWDGLMLPIKMAFFFFSTPAGKMIALYPSPAGPTESLLTLDTWEDIVAANPVLRELEPDVEALLVNRVGPLREHFLAPIDECYKLVGLIRIHWRGLSGGTEVWREINSFFDELKRKSRGFNSREQGGLATGEQGRPATGEQGSLATGEQGRPATGEQGSLAAGEQGSPATETTAAAP